MMEFRADKNEGQCSLSPQRKDRGIEIAYDGGEDCKVQLHDRKGTLISSARTLALAGLIGLSCMAFAEISTPSENISNKDEITAWKKVGKPVAPEEIKLWRDTPDEHVGDESNDCVPMYDWQDGMNPACNIFHEQDMSNTRAQQGSVSSLFTNGGLRDVWQLKMPDETEWALKTFRFYKHGFKRGNQRGQAMDAVISEQLTSSPYIASIYGYCSFSALYAFGNEGNINDVYPTSSIHDRLRMAVDASRALADLHSIGDGKHSPVAHADFSGRQFMMTNGLLYLTDFNSAKFLRWNPKNKTVCPAYKVRAANKKNRAPEEVRHSEVNLVSEKSDVYSLGNIFYKFLENGRKYHGMKWEKVRKKILSGDIPELSKENEKSTNIPVVALRTAMRMCFVADPDKRPSAMEVAEYLHKQLLRIGDTGEQNPIVWKDRWRDASRARGLVGESLHEGRHH